MLAYLALISLIAPWCSRLFSDNKVALSEGQKINDRMIIKTIIIKNNVAKPPYDNAGVNAYNISSEIFANGYTNHEINGPKAKV